ncbi:MAG: DUF2207 domain-containing protein [Coriobacteriia bacterium]|nr:DUF2207 domain-containing protein [Coriobacteriia bacterium]
MVRVAHRRRREVSEALRYLREIPDDLGPAIAAAVRGRGRIGDEAIIATLVDWAARGIATVRTAPRHVTTIAGPIEEQTLEFVLDVDRWAELDRTEQALGNLLFTQLARSAALGLLDLKTAMRRGKADYLRGRDIWRATVVDEAVRRGLLQPGGKRRTEAGDALAETLDALERYLADFGAFEDDPVAAHVLWGRYLAFAALFGEAERVLDELGLDIPGDLHDTALALRALAAR